MFGEVTVKRKLQDRLIGEDFVASTLIPVVAYNQEDKLFYGDDQTLGFGFVCEPLCGADEKIQERMIGFLNQEFPKNSVMQFILFRSPDINDQMYRMGDMRSHQHDPLLSGVIKERISFLKEHTQERIIGQNHKGIYDSGIVQDLKLFVTLKVPLSEVKPSREEILETSQLQIKVKAGLQSIGLWPIEMTALRYIRIMSTFFNWGKDSSWAHEGVEWKDDRTIANQILDYGTDIEIEKSGIRLGNTHAKVLSAKRLPEAFYFGDALAYVGDLSGSSMGVKENYAIICNVFFPDPQKFKNKMETKRQAIVNQAYGPMLKFVPILADKKDSFDILYESMNKGNKGMQLSYHMVIFAPTKERADSAAIQARNVWRESRFEIMEDKFISLPMFLNCLPLCTDLKAVKDLFRYTSLTSEQATVILPIFGEWKGTGTYHAALMSRNGQLMSLSLHDSDTNKNLLIAAESGSGKSFLANELLFAYASEGAQIWVIDVGRSYEKLCETMKGDFIHFGEEVDICLNPFTRVHPDEFDEDEDALVALICAMASPTGTLTDWQVSEIKRVLRDLWAVHKNALSIDNIADACSKSDDRRLQDVGTQLYAFTSKGAYGKYFAGPSNVSFRSNFTVLELDDLQGRKHLRQVVLLQLIFQIQQEVFLGERNRKKILFIDEAWQLLSEGEVAVFIEHAYRKFRKYGGSVAIATQSLNDLYQNKTGQAIAENSSSMYLLGQTEETVESIKRSGRLTMSDGGFSNLKTVHTVGGIYSELFIKSKSGMGIGRLIVGDFQKLLYSTTAEDVNDIKQYTRKGYNVTDAINLVLGDRGIKG